MTHSLVIQTGLDLEGVKVIHNDILWFCEILHHAEGNAEQYISANEIGQSVEGHTGRRSPNFWIHTLFENIAREYL